MSRLFVSPRDAKFISDVTKELMKDVIGAKVYYYRLRDDLTSVNETYLEAEEKFFDDPIIIDAFLKKDNHEVRTNSWGKEEYRELKLHFHHEDLIDRDIKPREGDIVAWGEHFYEITGLKEDLELWGDVRYIIGLEAIARQVREGYINAPLPGNVGSKNIDVDAWDDDWQQSHGYEEYDNGQITNDTRHLDKDGKVVKPERQNKSSRLGEAPYSRNNASFYDNLNFDGYDD
jgi:hypothetical protein